MQHPWMNAKISGQNFKEKLDVCIAQYYGPETFLNYKRKNSKYTLENVRISEKPKLRLIYKMPDQ
jgi:hypothetical protein